MSELALEYANIIKDFLDERTRVEQFEKDYLARFGSEERQMTEVEYDTLNGVFTDLDCYDPDELVEYGPSLNERELRASIAERYLVLKRIISD